MFFELFQHLDACVFQLSPLIIFIVITWMFGDSTMSCWTLSYSVVVVIIVQSMSQRSIIDIASNRLHFACCDLCWDRSMMISRRCCRWWRWWSWSSSYSASVGCLSTPSSSCRIVIRRFRITRTFSTSTSSSTGWPWATPCTTRSSTAGWTPGVYQLQIHLSLTFTIRYLFQLW